jgi:hypothetical protein
VNLFRSRAAYGERRTASIINQFAGRNDMPTKHQPIHSIVAFRRVVALTSDGRKLLGYTTDNHEEANAILHQGVYFFGKVKRTKRGYKIIQPGYGVRRAGAEVELCRFPLW